MHFFVDAQDGCGDGWDIHSFFMPGVNACDQQGSKGEVREEVGARWHT